VGQRGDERRGQWHSKGVIREDRASGEIGNSDGMGKRPADKERLAGESTGKAGGTGVEAAARR
jgi:hypothetical protein